MKRIICFLLLLFYFNQFFSQEITVNNFEPLKSKGNLPDDFTQRTSVKITDAIDVHVAKKDRKTLKKKKQDFLLKSNFMIDNLLMSGNVLFGDEVSVYVNKIADKLLINEPKLRSELRFYTLKSNVTNAFATNQGMIFITLGLISQLENEAQLAFVLGHEINHYKKKHLINTIIETDKILTSSKGRQVNYQDSYISKLSNYSKKLELESDSAGFYYIENAGYDLNEVLSSFDVLQFSHLPYNEIELDFKGLAFDRHSFSSDLVLDSLMPINFDIDEDDALSSHPNLKTRRDKIKEIINARKGGEKFIVSQSDFFKVRELSRFESIRIDLKNTNYVRAYYNIKFLETIYPNNEYLNNCYLKAIYGLSKFKLSRKYSKIASEYTSYEGAISRAYHFFEKIDINSLSMLTIKNLFEENKSDSSFSKKLNNLVLDVINNNGGVAFKHEKFFDFNGPKEFNEMNEDSTSKEDKDANTDSKYFKLRAKRANLKAEEAAEESKELYKLLFKDYKYNEEIKALFEEQLTLLINGGSLEKQKTINLSDKEYKKKKNNINLDKVVFVDPQYLRVNEYSGIKLLNSEDHKYDFYDQMESISDQLDFDIEILTPKYCNIEDVEKLNHLAICNDWVEEMNLLGDLNDNFIPSQSEYMKELVKHYGTTNLGFTGVLEIKQSLYGAPILAQLALFFPYTTIPAAILFFGGERDTYYYTYIYDATTGLLKVENVYNIQFTKATSGNIQSMMYDNFLKLKN